MSNNNAMLTTTRRAEQAGLVRDNRGYAYVALHPGYSERRTVRQYVLAFRIIVCIFSFIVLLLSIIGQVIPFCQEGKEGRYQIHYTVWQEQVYTKKISKAIIVEYNEHAKGVQVFAILAAVFGLVAFILAAFFASCWPQSEAARRAEEDANEKLQVNYGTERTGSQDSDDTVFPYENERVVNDRVAYIPFEAEERRRRRQDRDLGIALFSLLLAAALCALITLIFMSTFRSNQIDEYYQPKDREGLPLFIVALVFAVVAAVLVAIPPATKLYLCCAPPAVPADLMVLEAAQEESATQHVRTQAAPRAAAEHGSRGSAKKHQRETQSYDYGEYTQEEEEMRNSRHTSPPPPPPPAAQMQPATNPYYPPNLGDANNTNMAVAQGIPMALPGPPIEALQQQQQQQQSGYTSGAYYEAPPQLFNVRNNGGKGGKGKSV